MPTGILRKLWNGLKRLGGLIMPVFAKTSDVRALGPRLRWTMHFTLLFGILVVLGFLNYLLNLEKLLHTPLPVLRKVWLPLLFFIIYLLSWLGGWLWILLGAEEESSHHPDIDAAWDAVVDALSHAKLNLAELPVFLVLGQPAGTERALFAGAQLELTLEQVPKDPAAPLHVYASPDGIYLTCPEASLLGKQSELLSEEPAEEENKESHPLAEPRPVEDDSGRSMVQLGDQPPEARTSLPARGDPSTSVSVLAEKPESRVLLAAERPALANRRTTSRMLLLKNTPEVERLQERLRHLCWLVLKERRPYCPINGILLCVPFSATNSDTEANQTGLICQYDLAAIQDVLQIHCPVFALVCDMEKLPGFREFIDRFPKGHRQRRLGQQFPYVSDLTSTTPAQLIDSGVDWICNELFPPLIYRLMRLEKTTKDKMSAVIRGNGHLYHLLCQMRERRRRLARILSLAISSTTGRNVLFGGCYIAGTGRNPTREQAFIAAVFHRLLENQNFVAWTEAAQAEEKDYRRWTRYGYIALATFVVVLCWMGVVSLMRR